MIELTFRDYPRDHPRDRLKDSKTVRKLWKKFCGPDHIFYFDSQSENKNRFVTKQTTPITANHEPITQTLTPAFLPDDCIRQPASLYHPGLPNRLATDLLQKIAFAPIFLSHATRFAERLVKHRLCSMDKFDDSLTHQTTSFVTHRFNLVARARSSLELSWSNELTQRSDGDEQPAAPGFTWKKLEIDGLGQRFAIENGRMRFFHDCGRCKPHCRHENGSLYWHRQRQMRQLWCSPHPLLTKMAIDLRIPYLQRPPQGCAAAMSAHLAVAICRHLPGFNVKALKRMNFCILRRVFNIQTRLQMMAQVTQIHCFMTCTLALQCSIKPCIKICYLVRSSSPLTTHSSHINLGAQLLFPPVKRRLLPLRIFLRILDYNGKMVMVMSRPSVGCSLSNRQKAHTHSVTP